MIDRDLRSRAVDRRPAPRSDAGAIAAARRVAPPPSAETRSDFGSVPRADGSGRGATRSKAGEATAIAGIKGRPPRSRWWRR